MPLSSQSSGISNCIKAPFDPLDKTSPGEWSICYNLQQQKLTLSVQLFQPEPTKQALFVCTLDTAGLNDLLEFLAVVKMRINQPA
ncbi:hypothetical protein ACFO3I_14365 [Rheinheimera marina]|uniref:Uncharacterized protein n=1 Tax=Rheinheimera marina TaxID=1774958 RepID=A0ABV9JPM9_9GAMM